MNLIDVTKKCSLCGGEQEVKNIDAGVYSRYQRGGLNILEAFPDMPSHDREVLITGTCYKCQEKLYNMPLVSDPAKFGKLLGRCVCCDCRVYEKEKKESGLYQCVSCGCEMELVDGELVEVEE